MKKVLFNTLVATLFLTANAQAQNQLLLKPVNCPSAEAIISSGLTSSKNESGTWLLAQAESNFSLPESWSFMMASVEANTFDEAKEIAKNLLEHAQVLGPLLPSPSSKNWICLYRMENKNHQTALGIASNPPEPLPIK